MLLERVYDSSPLFLQNLMVSVQGWRFHRERYGSAESQRANAELLANESKSLDELKREQAESLRIFLAYCFERSPYYRQLFQGSNVNIHDIRGPEDLPCLPITRKEDLRARTQDFFTEKIGASMVAMHTSGTTGSPLTVYFSPSDVAWRFAFLERCRRWAGLRIGMRRACFMGRNIIPQRQQGPPFWRHNLAARQLLFSTYHLAPENLPAYVEALARFKPDIVEGYPSGVHAIAEHIVNSGQAGRIIARAVLLTAETVLPHQREVIEKAFQAKVFNQYSSSDGAPFISECRNSKLHVQLDSGIIELITPDGTPAKPGEQGEMVVTSFTTHVTPMIRFAIGDTAVASGAICDCGLPFPLVDAILGRVDDILYTPDRGYIGRMDTVFKALPNCIIEAQIVQTSPRRIVLRLVPDRRTYTPGHAAQLMYEMRRKLGDRIDIVIEEVGAIERTRNGKLRPVINLCLDQLPPALRYGVPGARDEAGEQVQPSSARTS